jgi:hypothetical protein
MCNNFDFRHAQTQLPSFFSTHSCTTLSRLMPQHVPSFQNTSNFYSCVRHGTTCYSFALTVLGWFQQRPLPPAQGSVLIRSRLVQPTQRDVASRSRDTDSLGWSVPTALEPAWSVPPATDWAGQYQRDMF